MRSKTAFIIVSNVVIFSCICTVLLMFQINIHAGERVIATFLKPIVQGFYCDDQTIDKPYKVQTVTLSYLYPTALLLVIVCLSIGVVHHRKICTRRKFIIDVGILLTLFVYGSCICLVITNIAKYFLGTLRPHYLSVCQPDWLQINCTNEAGRKILILGDGICQTNDSKLLKLAHLSFPSLHASFASYTSIFLILYLKQLLNYNRLDVLPNYFFQVLLAAAALYIGLTRVSDYHCHPSDVIAGFVIGFMISLVMHYSFIGHRVNEVNKDLPCEFDDDGSVTLDFNESMIYHASKKSIHIYMLDSDGRYRNA